MNQSLLGTLEGKTDECVGQNGSFSLAEKDLLCMVIFLLFDSSGES